MEEDLRHQDEGIDTQVATIADERMFIMLCGPLTREH